MKIAPGSLLKAALFTLALVACLLFYGFWSYGKPVAAFDIESGTAGEFTVGEGKEAILSRLPGQTYSPSPKPAACPGNWIAVGSMTATHKQCLLESNEWEVSDGVQELCPEKTDRFATLHFSDGVLVKVSIRCLNPE